MKTIFSKYLKAIIGGVIGTIGGFLYWFYIGCSTGTCPITSSPVISTIWGAIIGALLLSSFTKKENN
ncbi:MAG: DUF6132 family protein [Muribaculaceae bacterium]